MIAIMSSPDVFKLLARSCLPERPRIVALDAGGALFRQGDEPPGLPRVVQGQVDLVRWTEVGRTVRVHVARPGETFAEASLYADGCHCDAVAAAPSVVHLLPRRAVLRAFRARPALAEAFTMHLAHALMDARRLLELRAVTPLTARALARLDELADADGAIPHDVSLASIAADLDVTPPALYRAIAALKAQGALSRPARGRVRLRSRAAAVR